MAGFSTQPSQMYRNQCASVLGRIRLGAILPVSNDSFGFDQFSQLSPIICSASSPVMWGWLLPPTDNLTMFYNAHEVLFDRVVLLC